MWIRGLDLKRRALKDLDENCFNELYTDLSIEWEGQIEALFADDYYSEFKEFLSKYPEQNVNVHAAFGMKLKGIVRYVDICVFRVYLGAGSEAIFRKRGDK